MRYQLRQSYCRKTEPTRDQKRERARSADTHVETAEFANLVEIRCNRFFASRETIEAPGQMGGTLRINVAVGTRSPNAVCRRWHSKADDPPPPAQPWTPSPDHGKRLAALALAASRQLAALIAAGRATPPSVDQVTGESLRRSSVDSGAIGGVSGGAPPHKESPKTRRGQSDCVGR